MEPHVTNRAIAPRGTHHEAFEEICQSHDDLVALLKVSPGGPAHGILESHISGLRARAQHHFALEGHWMIRIHFPETLVHTMDHAEFLATLDACEADLIPGDGDRQRVSQRLHIIQEDWLEVHDEGRPYREWMRYLNGTVTDLR